MGLLHITFADVTHERGRPTLRLQAGELHHMGRVVWTPGKKVTKFKKKLLAIFSTLD